MRRKLLGIELEQIKKLTEIEKQQMEMETEMTRRKQKVKLDEQLRFLCAAVSQSLQNPETNQLTGHELNLAKPELSFDHWPKTNTKHYRFEIELVYGNLSKKIFRFLLRSLENG